MTSLPQRINSRNANIINIDGNLFLIICISLIAVIGVLSIAPVLPTIAKDLHIPIQEVGLIMAVFLLPTTFGSFIFGALADRVNRKKILIPSLLVFGLGGILCAFTNNFRSLLEWRFLAGLGSASLEALGLTLIGDLYTGKALTAVMGFNAAMIGVAATIYPLIGGALAALNWRYAFLLSALAFPLALLIATKLKLPNKQNETQDLNLKVYFKNSLIHINNPQVLALLFTIFSLFIIEFGAYYIYIPMFAAKTLGASSTQIGIILSCESIVFALAASQVGFLARRFSEKTLITFGYLVFGLSLLIVPAIHNVWLLIIPIIIFGASQALAFPPLQAMLAEIAPEGYRAGFMALNVTVQSLGRALGGLVAGIAFNFWGMQGVFYASSALAIITIVVFNLPLTSRKLKPLKS